MAGEVGQETYSNVDLVCALCDNGGEIARCMSTFLLFNIL